MCACVCYACGVCVLECVSRSMCLMTKYFVCHEMINLGLRR